MIFFLFSSFAFFQGKIDEVFLEVPNAESIPVVTSLKGKPYTEENICTIAAALKGVSTEDVKHAINHSL